MNVFQKFWKMIVESDNQKYLDEIKEVKEEVLIAKIQNDWFETELKNHSKSLIEKQELVTELEQEIKLLTNPLQLSEVIKPKNIKYKWKPTKNTLLRHSLNKLSEDSEYQGKYLSFLIGQGLKDSYSSEKQVILKTYMMAKSYLQSDNDNYDTDQESFGVKEYWLTPQESFDYYVGGDEGDCDDYSAFIYGCLVTSLLHFGYDTKNLFRADVNIIGSCGHAVIEWWSKEDEQFLHLESTYRSDRAYKVFNTKRDITKSVYTDVMRFFNEKQEYVLK